MSVFAKIFIVLNLFLSILFLGVAATVLTNRTDYKRQLEEQVLKVQELERTREKIELDARSRTDSLYDDIKGLQNREEGLVKERDQLRGDKLDLSNKLTDSHLVMMGLSGSQKSLGDNYSTVTAENTKLVELTQQQEKSLNEYKDAMERAKNSSFAAMADNQRLQDELVSREQHISDLTEELNEYKSKIEHLRAQGIDVARLAETKVPAPLDGKIVAVHTGVGLVMVNLGEKHGVEKGMNFTVYRGDQYVGQVIVEEVFPDMASARIDTRFQKQEVREGDDVTTRIR